MKHIKNAKFLSDSRGPHGPDLSSPCGRKFEFQSATSSLSVEQNLVHLDRFTYFDQKVVGVTLKRLRTRFTVNTFKFMGVFNLGNIQFFNEIRGYVSQYNTCHNMKEA